MDKFYLKSLRIILNNSGMDIMYILNAPVCVTELQCIKL